VPTHDGLLLVGRIGRAHGLAGDVIVHLTTNRMERVAVGSQLHSDDGVLTVVTSRPNKSDFVVRFDGVSDRNAAEALVNTDLYAEPLDDPDELWVHDLVGATVVDQTGAVRGTVGHIEANPASDLLVLDGGVLVPVRFVTELDDGVVHVDVPDGLFDLA
jgi:16S rRNA processing protein RimM